jgi:Arc/MetJ family transcription regulator
MVYALGVGRTNVVIDDELMASVMKRYRFRTKREAIDFALRRLVNGRDPYELALKLRGTGWEGDIHEMRDSKPAQEF